MKIKVIYESGPARDLQGSADYMLADISALDLDRDELYAEVDPYSFLQQMNGTEKLCGIYPEYASIIREYDPCDTGGLEDLAEAFSNQDRDFDTEDFWIRMQHTFLWEADQYTGPYLKAEIIAQAEAMGIDKNDLIF